MSETNNPPVPSQQSAPGNAGPEISYQIMPRPGQPIGQVPAPVPAAGPSGSGGGSSKWIYIVIGVVVLLALGAIAYYFLGTSKKTDTSSNSTTSPQSKLSVDFMQKYFAKATCDDPSTCGDNADPDNDGLTNYDEFVHGTSPTNPDTDSDGIADGDELNVYGTNPTNSITDTRTIAKDNGYTDGSSIKNGYDPLTPGSKYTETSLAQIQMKISQFKLHAPTTTTLGLNEDGSKAVSTGTSINPDSGTVNPPPPTGTAVDTTR